MSTTEMLMQFGLTRQEATIYLSLFSNGELSGYEAAKVTGISRSNTYSALAGLVEKGAAYVIEDTAVKYTPVPVEEFSQNKIKFMKRTAKALIQSIPRRETKASGYITIKGDKHIEDKIESMLEASKERVYISMENSQVEKFLPALQQLICDGIKVVVITNEPFILNGAIIYLGEEKKAQVRLIVDSKFVLTGEIGENSSSTCLFSSNNNLIDVFKEALANEIKLLNMRKDVL